MNNKIFGLVLTLFATATITFSGAPVIIDNQPQPPVDEPAIEQSTDEAPTGGISTFSLMQSEDNC